MTLFSSGPLTRRRCGAVAIREFGSGNFKRPGVLARMTERLADFEHERERPHPTTGWFARLLDAVHRQAGPRVLVLVDEYDDPILGSTARPAMA